MRHGLGDCTEDHHCGCLDTAPAAVDHTQAITEAARDRTELRHLLDQLDAAEAALARARKLHGGWSSQADFNAEMGGDFWRGMAIKGRECADELRRAVDGGEQS